MKRILNITAAVFLAAVILVSCELGPQGLFAGLEREEPLNKGTTVFNENTAQFVLRFGADYYAAVGKTLLTRPAAGGTWETVTVPGAPSGSVISSGVSYGANLYISYAPEADTVFQFDGTTWDTLYDDLSTGNPVQALLMASDGQLFAVTQSSTGSSYIDYSTEYSIHYDSGGGTFASSGADVTNVACGVPSSVAVNGGTYWITAGNKVFTGPETLLLEDAVPSTYISATKPVFSVYHDGARAIVSGTGYLFNASSSYTLSSVFGSSDRRLSAVAVVPANGGTANAVVVGVKPWSSDDYRGYYEYDAVDNGTFSTVTPDTAYTMISTNSNYVTTLDDLSIEGFYYDSLGYNDLTTGNPNFVLFARTVKGGLWSNRYDDVTKLWSGWDRE